MYLGVGVCVMWRERVERRGGRPVLSSGGVCVWWGGGGGGGKGRGWKGEEESINSILIKDTPKDRGQKTSQQRTCTSQRYFVYIHTL